jgi:demethylmenaquinone methyltransferase/2-methoxy-6-polyprenyl-1,4-benzoquinol methylase
VTQQHPAWDKSALGRPHEAPDKADRVRRMFDAVAPRYELINALFSFGIDRRWRRRAVALARVTREDEILDVACGTGDFARAFARAGPRRIVGCDFSHEMLCRAVGRDERTRWWCEADVTRLPFPDESFSIVSSAFGVRNFQGLGAGLREMHRVLRPGGRAVVLEFSRPRGALSRAAARVYCGGIMPVVASWISGDGCGAYRYLPKSIDTFPDGEDFRALLREAGFRHTRAERLTFGMATIYLAYRERAAIDAASTSQPTTDRVHRR